MTGAVHVVGAGMAGLAAAVWLVQRGVRVVVHESATHAGGRCRTFEDSVLGCEIDNGNHLLMAANPATLAYLDAIGARATLVGPDEAEFRFVDLERDQDWTLRPNRSRLPWWLFSESRRIPGTRPWDYLSGFAMMLAGADKTVADYVRPGSPLYRTLWRPLCLAVMNAAPEEASARLLGRVMRETFGKGGAACRPFMARDGLGHSLVDPALRTLRDHGAEIRFKDRLRAVTLENGTATGLTFTGGGVALAEGGAVAILAIPHEAAGSVLPGFRRPTGARSILNAHFRLPAPVAPALDRTIVGVVGGLAQWLFLRGDLVSVTVSAAGDAREQTPDALLAQLWRDVADSLARLGAPPEIATQPPGRLVHEKRATFLQTPDQVAQRPGVDPGRRTVFLAGDWTETGLPATIEGAIRSGNRAAERALRTLG